MTGEAWAVLAGVALTVLCNWALMSYYSGRMVERVSNHGAWLSDLERAKDNHERRISRIEGRHRTDDQHS